MFPEGKLREFFTNLYLLRVAIALWLVILLFEPLAKPTNLFEGLLVYESGPQSALDRLNGISSRCQRNGFQ